MSSLWHLGAVVKDGEPGTVSLFSPQLTTKKGFLPESMLSVHTRGHRCQLEILSIDTAMLGVSSGPHDLF